MECSSSAHPGCGHRAGTGQLHTTARQSPRTPSGTRQSRPRLCCPRSCRAHLHGRAGMQGGEWTRCRRLSGWRGGVGRLEHKAGNAAGPGSRQAEGVAASKRPSPCRWLPYHARRAEQVQAAVHGRAGRHHGHGFHTPEPTHLRQACPPAGPLHCLRSTPQPSGPPASQRRSGLAGTS